ncbi:hypothetical protein SELMODRAFT_432344 [Selaginella moellendorffii]|uniref:Uncharacterized protein n=1 Tax=Selaginella moellendorffii TaxID=88036 RepID=D8TFQ4_SELML|nr:hypothetical protein SELMODRAFT_432344 [Selaginella moellendorffii]
MRKHGSLENILSAAAIRAVGKPYIQDALKEHSVLLEKNMEVLSLRRDINVELPVEWCRDKSNDLAALQWLEKELEMLHRFLAAANWSGSRLVPFVSYATEENAEKNQELDREDSGQALDGRWLDTEASVGSSLAQNEALKERGLARRTRWKAWGLKRNEQNTSKEQRRTRIKQGEGKRFKGLRTLETLGLGDEVTFWRNKDIDVHLVANKRMFSSSKG